MTVNTELSKRIYTGNGVATDYDYDFKIPLAGDLAVSLFDLDGVELPQVLNTDYTVTGAGGDNGGKVLFSVAPPAGYTILLLSDATYTQPTDFKNQGRFFPETHENAIDRAVILARQNHEAITRSITLPPQVSGVSTQLPVPQVSTLFGWNGDGSAIENFPLATIATQIAYGDKNYQVFAGTGAQVNFTLPQNPGSLGNLDVSIDGVTQVPGADYTYSGTTLTFTSAPTNGAVILVRFDVAVPIGEALASSTRFVQDGSGAVLRNAQDKMREQISVKDFGAVGDSVTLETAQVQAALNSGRDVLIPDGGTYVVGALTMTTPGQRLLGNGTLKAVAGANHQLLRVLANDVVIDGVRFDGTAAKSNTGQVNDIIRVESVSGVKVQNCRINGSKGGGIAILNSSRCIVTGNYITSVNDNGILVANLGADDNVVSDNIVIGTSSQNCIFLTADSSSLPTTDYIYRNTVTGNVCRNATDTGIEVGQHCVDSTVTGNVVANCANPEILIRDAIGTVVSGNVVHCDVNGSATHDGIVWLEHNETNWDYRGICTGNVIYGRITRSGILLQGANNVLVEGNRIQETVATVNATTGVGLVGIGIQVEGTSYGIRIHDNDIRRLEYGVLFNVAGAPVTFTDCSINGNAITYVSQGIAMGGATFTRARFSDNTISAPVLYCVNNAGADGTNTSSIDNNAFNLSGFSAASPVAVNIADWRSRFFTEAGGNDSGWIAPSFQNSWGNLGGAYQTAAFRKVAGRVYLRGVISGGTATDGTTLFTLPSGFGPAATESFRAANANSPNSDTRVEITSTGAVTVQGSVNNSYLSLSGISFHAN